MRPGLKTLDDALRIRARILTAFERAEATADPAEQMEWLTFVIVGGGATGVELAGTLAEIARHTLKREFRHIDPAAARVLLIEAGSRVLPAFPPSLSTRHSVSSSAWGSSCARATPSPTSTTRGVWIGEGADRRAHRIVGRRGRRLSAGRDVGCCPRSRGPRTGHLRA